MTVNRSEQLWAYHKHKISGRTTQIQLRNTIAEAHRNLVRKIAHRWKGQCAEEFADLEQIGFLGLMRAIERFDPTQGNAFSSFAVPYIRGEILHFLRDHGSGTKIPRRWREANSAASRVERAWAARNGGTMPTEAQLSEATGIPAAKLRLVREAVGNQTAISLEEHEMDFAAPETRAEPTRDPRFNRAVAQMFDNLIHLPAIDQELVNALYFQRHSRKAVAKDFRIEPADLKVRIQAILTQLATIPAPVPAIAAAVPPRLAVLLS